MIQTKKTTPPSEVLDGLFAGCMIVGLLAGIVLGYRLFNSLTSEHS